MALSGPSNVTIGYKYYLGLHLIYCQGPVVSFGPLYADKKQLIDWTIRIDDPLVSNGTLNTLIFAENIFGGLKKQGGVVGGLDVNYGGSDMLQNFYLLQQEGFTAQNTPAYRGLMSLIFNGGYVGTTASIKPWSAQVYRPAVYDWYPAKAEINPVSDGSGVLYASANGAHMLWETLTNTEWGMGIAESQLDEVSFKAAADTLFDENLGLSMILTAQTTVENFAQEILRHINALPNIDPETGKFTLTLIRDDYTIGTLPVFDESNIIGPISFQRPSLSDLVNEVVLTYRPRGMVKDAVVSAQNLANVQVQGKVVSESVNFPGIDNEDIASKVVARELKQRSTPLAQVSLTTNRTGWDVKSGDVIALTWPQLDISLMPLRVIRVRYGKINDGKITLDCVEDVFGLPTTGLVGSQGSNWVDPVKDAVPVVNYRLEELTYFEIATGFPVGELIGEGLTAADSYIAYIAERPIASPSYQLYSRIGANDYKYRVEGYYAAQATLTNELNYTDSVDIQFSVFPRSVLDVQVDTYAFMNNEILRIDAIDLDNNRLTLGRGCIDSHPQVHPAGSVIWFAQNNWALDQLNYGIGAEVDFKALVETGSDILDIGSAPEVSITPVGRAYKPYPANNVQYNDAYYFPSQYGGNIPGGAVGVRISWVDRNRLQQTVRDSIIDWYDSNITVESGVTYKIDWYGEYNLLDTDAPSTTATGETGPSYDWTTEVADSAMPVYGVDPTITKVYQIPLIADGSASGGLTTTVSAVSFGTGRAVFNTQNSYIETSARPYLVGGSTGVGGLSYSGISLRFRCEDAGDDLQVIMAESTVSGSGEKYSMALMWRRSDYTLHMLLDEGVPGAASEPLHFRVTPDVDHDIAIMITRNTNPNPDEITFEVYMDGRSQASPVYEGSLLPTPTKPFTFGCGWSDTSTRDHFFRGSIWDFKSYDDVDNTDFLTDGIWTGEFRPNTKHRAVITAQRDVDNLTSFDYTVPVRDGWGLNWGGNWGSIDL